MKRLISIFTFIILVLVVSFSTAFAVGEEWAVRYDGDGTYNGDHVKALAVDSAGNVYVTGYSYVSGSDDFATVKYDTNGNQLWVARYNLNTERAQAIAVDTSGNVYVTGFTYGVDKDFATIKYDSNGIEQWVKTYNGPGDGIDEAVAIAVDSAGGVYVTGHSVGRVINNDICTIKYDSDGKRKWVARYEGPNDDEAQDITVDSAGNVYVTGSSFGSNDYDYVTIKYNTKGKQEWVKTYNYTFNGTDKAQAIAVDSAGNVYVTGYSDQGSFYVKNDYATIKYDTNGNQQWAIRYNGPINDDDSAHDLAIDSAGNVYVTGASVGADYSHDYATIKYDTNGIQKWVARYQGMAIPGYYVEDRAKAIAVDSAGNVNVTGHGPIGSVTEIHLITIQYNAADGSENWKGEYNNAPWLGDADIAVDSSNNVYVAGTSKGSTTYDDYVTIKYSADVSETPEEKLQELIDLVTSFNLQQGISNSQDSKLQNALKSLESLKAGNRQDAINKLDAFRMECYAQRGKALTNSQADSLIILAQEIIAAILAL